MPQELKCYKCTKVCASQKGLMQHFSKSHGGYSTGDLVKSGLTSAKEKESGSGIARTLAGGFDSPGAVAAAAPLTDAAAKAAAEESKPRRSSKLSQADLDKAERAEKARERIGQIICRKAARGPYVACAALLNDPRWLLIDEEEKEITEAMIQLAEASEWDFSRPIFAWIAIVAAHSDAIMARLPLLLQPQAEPEPPKPAPEKRPN